MENEQCRETEGNDEWVHNSTVCTFRPAGRGTCHGDSGGPLIAGGELVGIASWVQLPCGSPFPDGFTRVSSFIDWIEEVTELGIVDE